MLVRSEIARGAACSKKRQVLGHNSCQAGCLGPALFVVCMCRRAVEGQGRLLRVCLSHECSGGGGGFLSQLT